MAVSNTKLRNAKPEAKAYRIQVGGNVYLEVLPTGTKVWRMRYRKPDTQKEAMYTFGKFPMVTQAEGGLESLRIENLVCEGIDPLEHKKTQKLETALQRKADSLACSKSCRLDFCRIP